MPGRFGTRIEFVRCGPIRCPRSQDSTAEHLLLAGKEIAGSRQGVALGPGLLIGRYCLPVERCCGSGFRLHEDWGPRLRDGPGAAASSRCRAAPPAHRAPPTRPCRLLHLKLPQRGVDARDRQCRSRARSKRGSPCQAASRTAASFHQTPSPSSTSRLPSGPTKARRQVPIGCVSGRRSRRGR